jgi:hypothetical protein
MWFFRSKIDINKKGGLCHLFFFEQEYKEYRYHQGISGKTEPDAVPIQMGNRNSCSIGFISGKVFLNQPSADS